MECISFTFEPDRYTRYYNKQQNCIYILKMDYV